VPFDVVMQKILHSYKDQVYREAEGLYIVFHGYVDVVNPYTRTRVHSLGLNESFGESKLVKQAGMEHMGDLYAGLYPVKKSRSPEKAENEEQTENLALTKVQGETSDVRKQPTRGHGPEATGSGPGNRLPDFLG